MLNTPRIAAVAVVRDSGYSSLGSPKIFAEPTFKIWTSSAFFKGDPVADEILP